MKTYMERMRELREDSDLTQYDIAQLLKTTQQTYSRYEQGINELPIRHLITLCRFYQVTSDYFLGLSDERRAVCSTAVPPGQRSDSGGRRLRPPAGLSG